MTRKRHSAVAIVNKPSQAEVDLETGLISRVGVQISG